MNNSESWGGEKKSNNKKKSSNDRSYNNRLDIESPVGRKTEGDKSVEFYSRERTREKRKERQTDRERQITSPYIYF